MNNSFPTLRHLLWLVCLPCALPWAHGATPVTLITEPARISAGDVRQVVVVAEVGLAPDSVLEVVLLRVDDQGSVLEDLALMHDDGTFGDPRASDGSYTCEVVLSADADPIRLRAQVSAIEPPKPLFSEIVTIYGE